MVVYRIVDEDDVAYKSNAFNGYYPTLKSAKRALHVIPAYDWAWKKDPQGHYRRVQCGRVWRIQATKVEWYDVS